MRRREFIVTLGGAAAAWPLAARAQQAALPAIGYLSSLTQADSVRFDAALRRGLSDMGYVEGQNISIQYRWITDRYDALTAMALDLVRHQVAVILGRRLLVGITVDDELELGPGQRHQPALGQPRGLRRQDLSR